MLAERALGKYQALGEATVSGFLEDRPNGPEAEIRIIAFVQDQGGTTPSPSSRLWFKPVDYSLRIALPPGGS